MSARVRRIIDGMSTLAGRPEADWVESIRALTTALDNLNTHFGHRGEVIICEPPAAGSTEIVTSE